MPEPTTSVGAQSGPVASLNGGAIGGPSTLRRDLLLRLRLDGPSSPDQLAAVLGASRTGVLQQLRALEAANLVTPPDRQARRRPAAASLRRHARRAGPLPVDLRRARGRPARRDRGGRRRRARRGGLPARRRQLGDRVREQLAERVPTDAPLVGAGPRAGRDPGRPGLPRRDRRWTSTASIRLREHNCAIYHVARGTPAACQAELELFREVLGADVVRETHIASGDRCCSYRIEERAGD